MKKKVSFYFLVSGMGVKNDRVMMFQWNNYFAEMEQHKDHFDCIPPSYPIPLAEFSDQ